LFRCFHKLIISRRDDANYKTEKETEHPDCHVLASDSDETSDTEPLVVKM